MSTRPDRDEARTGSADTRPLLSPFGPRFNDSRMLRSPESVAGVTPIVPFTVTSTCEPELAAKAPTNSFGAVVLNVTDANSDSEGLGM